MHAGQPLLYCNSHLSKRALSEAIAKKELELTALQSQIDQNKADNSNYNVRWLLGHVSMQCRFPLTEIFNENTPVITMDEKIKFDFAECINRKIFESTQFSALLETHRHALRNDVAAVSSDIKARQEEAIFTYHNFKKVPTDFQPRYNPISQSLYEMGRVAGVPEAEIEKARMESIFREAKDDVGYKLQDEVGVALRELMEKWRDK